MKGAASCIIAAHRHRPTPAVPSTPAAAPVTNGTLTWGLADHSDGVGQGAPLPAPGDVALPARHAPLPSHIMQRHAEPVRQTIRCGTGAQLVRVARVVAWQLEGGQGR